MELLKKLYSIHSMSGQEGAMRKFVKNYVKQNIKGATVRQDHGNIYIVKGESETYPCVAAHLDQVQKKHSPDFKVFEYNGVLFGFSAQYGRQEGLGADDKNGIWVALKCLERFDAMKVALFWGEETGCEGSSVADMGFFKDCRFVLQADRRNGGDLITDISGPICSDEFIEDISEIAKGRGYKETSGLMTDVETLADNGLGLSAINFSCGYYNPHTDTEITYLPELENCLGFAVDIIEKCTKVYPFERPRYSRFDWYDDWRNYYYYGAKKVTAKSIKGKEVKKKDTEKEIPDDIFLPDFNDYATPEDAIEDFIFQNLGKGNIYKLWDYISADCDVYGFDEGYYQWLVECIADENGYDITEDLEALAG